LLGLLPAAARAARIHDGRELGAVLAARAARSPRGLARRLHGSSAPGHTTVLELLARAAPERAHVRRRHSSSAPGHARFLELGIIVEVLVLARAAPERAHVATSRFLALLGGHIIHELVVAFVGHHAPPRRALEAIIIAASRRCSTAFGLVAISAFNEQTARSVPVTRLHLAGDARSSQNRSLTLNGENGRIGVSTYERAGPGRWLPQTSGHGA
jgi:hypothetical protein